MGGDFLKVFLHLEGSGVSEYTPWSGVLCGDLRDVPQVLYSSRSTLILEFHTQESSSSNATGFFGNFHFIDRRKLSFESFAFDTLFRLLVIRLEEVGGTMIERITRVLYHFDSFDRVKKVNSTTTNFNRILLVTAIDRDKE